ncbi:MAG: Hsp70 family protein [Desulfobacterales bacterium]
MSAKDLSTGARNSPFRSQRLPDCPESEIDRLIKDAELHADDDRRKKELVDARNAADALIYNTEKPLLKWGVAPVTGRKRESAQNNLKEVIKSDDARVIIFRTEASNRAAHLLPRAYQQQGSGSGCAGGNLRCRWAPVPTEPGWLGRRR